MKKLTEKIKAIVSADPPSPSLRITFIKSKKGILKELLHSKVSGNALGVYSRVMGDGMFLIMVQDLTDYGVVIFNKYDMSGLILLRYELALDEIQMVCPLNQRYQHPLLTTGAGQEIKVSTF